MTFSELRAVLLVTLTFSSFSLFAKDNSEFLRTLPKNNPYNLLDITKTTKELYVNLNYLTEEENFYDDIIDLNVNGTSKDYPLYRKISILAMRKDNAKHDKIGLRIKGLTFYYFSDKNTRWKLKLRKNKFAIRFRFQF